MPWSSPSFSARSSPNCRMSAEHAVARVARGGHLGEDDRLVDELAHQVENPFCGQVIGTADGRGAFQVVPAGEHRGPRPERLLHRRAQVVRPLDAGAQCLVPGLGVAVPDVEHRQPFGQPAPDLLGRQHPDPGRGELDGEGHSLQLSAQLGNCWCVVRGEREVGSSRRGAVQEQADCLVVRDGLRRGHGRLVRVAERRDDDDTLPAEPQWPPAGQQEGEVRTPRTQSHHQLDHRGDEVFAVVEHQQRGSLGEVVGQRVDPPRSVGDLQAQRLGHRGAQQVGIHEVRQRHHPTPVAVGGPRLLDNPEGDARLAHPTGPHQGHHTRGGKVLADVVQQCPTADEGCVEGECLDEVTLGAAVDLTVGPTVRSVHQHPGGSGRRLGHGGVGIWLKSIRIR